MNLLLPLLLPALQGADAPHSALHPETAEVYLECPDVPALLAAYDAAPMVRMMRDEQALDALHRLLGEDGWDGADLLRWAFPGDLGTRGLELLRDVAAASWSARGGDEPGALVICDLKSPEVAADVAAFVADLAAPLPTPESYATLSLPGTLLVSSALEGTPLHPLWVHHADRRVTVGVGSFEPPVWSGVLTGRADSARAALDRDTAHLGPPSGATVIDGYHTRTPVDLALDWAGAFGLLDALDAEVIAGMARTAGKLVFGTRPQRWRMQLRGDRFVTEIFEPGATHPVASLPWLGTRPVDPTTLAAAHAEAFLVHATTLDASLFLDDLLATLGEGRPSPELRAELESAVGFPLARLTDRLGPNVVTFAHPVQGIGLPRTFVLVDLRGEDSEGPGGRGDAGVIEDLTALAEALGERHDGFRAKKSKYKKRPYLSVTLPEDVVSLGELGTVRPAIGLLDGRLVLTNSSLNLKREIRRELGDEDPLPAPSYPWTASSEAFAGDAAVLYVDWGAQVDALFAMLRSFGGVIESFAGELPFDLTNLPDPRLFTRHMRPTLRTERVVEGGTLTRHEASFAFETWAGLVGLAAHVSQTLDQEPESPGEIAGRTGPSESEATRDALRAVRSSLAVYELDQGAYPDRLEGLLEPTATYPQGFAAFLPDDGWGRALRYELAPDASRGYRLWSVGPDGIDQNGEGDDVLP